MVILWYCYLGILAIAAIGGLFSQFRTPLGMLDFVISIITWIGLFGYVTDTQILTPLVWKVVFVIGLTFDIYISVKKFKEEAKDDDDTPQTIKLAIIGMTLILLLGPLYYGLFQYAFS